MSTVRRRAAIHFPARRLQMRDGYVTDDLLQTAQNLLSLGIKIGTDAYKSNTATAEFRSIGQALQRLFVRAPGYTANVPYGKATMRQMHKGTFDPEAALRPAAQPHPGRGRDV